MSISGQDSGQFDPQAPWPRRHGPHAYPPPEASDCVDQFLLPWAGPPVAQEVDCEDASPQQPPPYITASGRDLRIDILRGFFVFAMVINHVRGASPVQLLTGGNRFFTSAAEGFILTSGLMVGLVYHRIVARDGIGAAIQKLLSRTISLYLLTVGLTMVMMPISEVFALPWAQGLDLSQSLNLVVGVLTLHRTYYLADVMLLYTLLFLLTPPALTLLASGKSRELLAASWLLWGLHQFFPSEASITWPVAGNLLFTFSAWQVLFFSGMVLGYQRSTIPSLTRLGQRNWQILTGVAFLALMGLYWLLEQPVLALPAPFAPLGTGLDGVENWLREFAFGKTDLRPGRLLASAVVFTFFFLTLTRQWKWAQRVLEPFLAPLGHSSLYAFTAHVVVVLVVALALIPFGMAADSPPWLNALLQCLTVGLIWLLVRWKVLAPTLRTRALWNASPIALAALAIAVLPWLPANPALARPGPSSVSAEALARARAYGTAIPRQAAVPRQATPPAQSPLPPAASALSTGVPATVMALVVPVAATPSPIPPATAMSMASPTIMESLPFSPTLTAAATATASRSPVTAATIGAPVRSQAAPTRTVTPLPRSQASPTGTATLLPRSPTPPAAPAGPLPPLPPDDQRVSSEYVGQIAGRAYDRTFRSELLNQDMHYWIYLPPGYGSTNRRYPVLYMLHGGGGSLDEWAAYGLFDVADEAFRTNVLPPFIIVLPQGDKSYWANGANNTPRWGDYLAFEVVNHIDATYGTLPTRTKRAVGGLSMGGWGAFHQGFIHPEIFGVIGSHSPSLYPDNDALTFLGTGAEFAGKDPLALVRVAPGLATLRIWIDIGDADPWLEVTTSIHNTLLARGVAHTWRLNPGPHAPEYWAQHVPEYVQWYARTLAAS